MEKASNFGERAQRVNSPGMYARAKSGNIGMCRF